MEGKGGARIVVAIFVGVAVTAALMEFAREDDGPMAEPIAVIAPSADPLRAEQRRCQRLGEEAANDADCLAVWAETRDRFLGRNGGGDR